MVNGSAICSDSGIDTVRFRWRTGDLAFKQFIRRPGGTIPGYREERYVQTPLGRVGAYPDGMCYMEGRASALMAGSPDEHGLASISELLSAERVALRLVQDSGVPLEDDDIARLGRVDLASELRFSRPVEGSAFLHSLAALDVPWCKSRTDGRKGSAIETVSFHGTTGKTIYLRAYDKGVESKTEGPGRRIRVERQKRYRKAREVRACDLTSANLHSIFLGREFSLLQNLPTATVCDVPQAMEVLWQNAATWSQFERLAGYIVAGDVIDYPEHILYRRAAELRSVGICVDNTQVERLEVPVGQYLQTLAAAWAA